MGRAARLLTAFIMLSTLLSGCWSRTEVNDIAIVTAIGLDRTKDGHLRISLLLAVPRTVGISTMGGGENKLENTSGWVVSEEGETIMDAIKELQKTLPRQIFYPHNQVIVIGERLARQEDVFTLIDFFQRYRQSQMRSYIMFTSREATDIMRYKPKFERLASEVLREENRTGVGLVVRLNEFILRYTEYGQDAYAPRVEIVPSEVKANPKEKHYNLVITGVGVMRGERLAGWLSSKEARGVLWLRDEIDNAVVTVDVPEERGGGKISAELQNSHTRIRFVHARGSVQVVVQVAGELNIYEDQSRLTMRNSSSLAYIESLFETDIEERIQSSWRKSQKLRADFAGIGQQLYKQHPRLWKSTYQEGWNDMLPDIDMQVNVDINIGRIGMIQDPIILK